MRVPKHWWSKAWVAICNAQKLTSVFMQQISWKDKVSLITLMITLLSNSPVQAQSQAARDVRDQMERAYISGLDEPDPIEAREQIQFVEDMIPALEKLVMEDMVTALQDNNANRYQALQAFWDSTSTKFSDIKPLQASYHQTNQEFEKAWEYRQEANKQFTELKEILIQKKGIDFEKVKKKVWKLVSLVEESDGLLDAWFLSGPESQEYVPTNANQRHEWLYRDDDTEPLFRITIMLMYHELNKLYETSYRREDNWTVAFADMRKTIELIDNILDELTQYNFKEGSRRTATKLRTSITPNKFKDAMERFQTSIYLDFLQIYSTAFNAINNIATEFSEYDIRTSAEKGPAGITDLDQRKLIAFHMLDYLYENIAQIPDQRYPRVNQGKRRLMLLVEESARTAFTTLFTLVRENSHEHPQIADYYGSIVIKLYVYTGDIQSNYQGNFWNSEELQEEIVKVGIENIEWLVKNGRYGSIIPNIQEIESIQDGPGAVERKKRLRTGAYLAIQRKLDALGPSMAEGPKRQAKKVQKRLLR